MTMRNACQTLTLVLTLLSATFLTGCETTYYTFRPPASDQGRMCITQCASIREACHGHESQRAQREKASCERSSDTAFHACMFQPVARDKEKDKAHECEKNRKSCWAYENTGRCETDYRECFINCGGAVEEHTK